MACLGYLWLRIFFPRSATLWSGIYALKKTQKTAFGKCKAFGSRRAKEEIKMRSLGQRKKKPPNNNNINP